MINYIIRKIPSRNVSCDDFPYIEGYFNYIIEQTLETLKSKDIPRPQLVIRDTPYLESHFLEYTGGEIVIFDVGVSLLLIKITSVLLRREFTKDAWLSLLTAGVNSLIQIGYPHIGVSLALNREWDRMDSLSDRDSDPLFVFHDNFWKGHGRQNANIRCQEMFILAHEVTHYFVSKNIYNLKAVTRTIYEDIIKKGSGAISTDIFFAEIFGQIKLKDAEKSQCYKEARKEFFSQSFREEILCDLCAAEITIEYFTWEFGQMRHEEVCASIQVVMRSLILATSLRSHLQRFAGIDNSEKEKRRLAVQLFLRTKVLDSFLSKIIKKQSNYATSKNDALKRIFEYDVIHFDSLRKITSTIETCFFRDIIKIITALEKAYLYIAPYIIDQKTSALYYSGYNNVKTKSDEFMETDGNVFVRDRKILKELSEKARVDIYKISEESIENAKKSMNSDIW